MKRLMLTLLVTAASLPAVCARGAAPETSAAIPGEVIVRLRNDTVATAMKQNMGAASAGTSALDTVLGRYGVKDLVPAFPDVSTAQPHPRALTRRRKGSAAGNGSLDLSGIYLVRVDAASDLSRLVADLSRDPNVMWAEPNQIYRTTAGDLARPLRAALSGLGDQRTSTVFNDPHLSSSGSWGQSLPDLWGLFAIGATDAWQISQGAGVVVAVGATDSHDSTAPFSNFGGPLALVTPGGGDHAGVH